MIITEKITMITIAWVMLSYLITNDTDIELFFTLDLLGILIIKLTSENFLPRKFNLKINILILFLSFLFFLFVIKKVISFKILS